MTNHKGWYSRGYLPHLDEPGRTQIITFRLVDSLPQTVLREIEDQLADFDKSILTGEMPAVHCQLRADRQRKLIEKYLDQGLGDCLLRDPRVGEMVENALRHFDGVRYKLIAWCVMPNHVHALVEMREEFRLENVVHSWKSYTSKEANRILGLEGVFWQREYFDRFIRNDEHLARVADYIEQNPVKARLVGRAEEWMFSSARRH